MVGTRKESKGKNPDLAGALYEGLIFSQQSRYQRALSISVLSLSHAQALLFSPFSLFFFHFFLFFSFIYLFFFSFCRFFYSRSLSCREQTGEQLSVADEEKVEVGWAPLGSSNRWTTEWFSGSKAGGNHGWDVRGRTALLRLESSLLCNTRLPSSSSS